MVTEMQLKEWLTDPTTVEFLSVLRAEEAAIREKIGDGAVLAPTADQTGVLYHQNIGRADGVASMGDIEQRFIDHERVEFEEEEDETLD